MTAVLSCVYSVQRKEIVMSLDSQQQSSLEDLQEETVQEVLDMSVEEFSKYSKDIMEKIDTIKYSVQDIIDSMVREKKNDSSK